METAEKKSAAETVSILLVDDDTRNLDVLESILESPELRLVRSQTPDEALLALVHEEFACIVLDVQMPNMSGVELARLIKTRKRSQNIPIIFLTAFFLEEKDILQGYGVGAVDYLTKPLNPAILKSKVGVFVNLFRANRALAKSNSLLEQEILHRLHAEEALRQSNIALEAHVQNRTADLTRANAELREGEDRYRQLVHSLPAAVYTTDAQGSVMLFNEAAVLLWGRKPEIGKDVWCGSFKIFNPDGTELPVEKSPMARTLKEGRSIRGREIVIERPDGTRRHILPYPEPIRDSTGKIIGAVNMLIDITDRKQAEDALQRLAAIVSFSDDAIISKDTNGIVQTWNRGAENLFGYRADEMIGQPILKLIPAERVDEEPEILRRIRRGEPVDHYETTRRRKDGQLIEISLTVSPIKNSAGKVIGASKVARDITDRKHAEEHRRRIYELVAAVNHDRKLSDIYELALETILKCQNADRASILLCDADGEMRFVTSRNLSEEYCRAVDGHSPWKKDESAEPIFINDIAHAELKPELRAIIEKEGIRSLAFIPIAFEKKLLGKFMIYYNSPHVFSLDEIRPAQTIGGQIAFAIERKRAETELKRAHDELLAASRAKDDFLATLSHELRTPLNPVLLIASDAVNNYDLPPRVRMDFEMIRKNVELEARLIDDLLDLTRITRGKIILEKSSLDIHSVLGDALKTVHEEIEQKQIAVTLKLSPEKISVFGDAVRLQQIFWNLLRNAAKFTPQNGSITVETEILPGDTRVAVRVSDTGIGMNDDEIARVFKVFSQGDHATSGSSSQFGGLGLGLAISQKLAEFHDGKIFCASEGRNRGATFTVELPLAKLAEKNGNAKRLANSRPTRFDAGKNARRILLVEDHEPTRLALAHLLTRRFYHVTTAGTIAEARSIADAQNFHLLISDIGLPDGNGYDLMIELKKNRTLPGIALTGYGMEQDLARSQHAGFIAHLTKPIRVQSLEAALNAAFDLQT